MRKVVGKKTIDQIIDSLNLPGNRANPEWFTVADFAQKKGLSRPGASDMLKKLVNAKILKVHKCVDQGTVKNFYEKL